MKKILVYFVLFMYCYGYSQKINNGIVTYTISMNNPNFSNLEKKKISQERISKVKEAFSSSKNAVAILLFNTKESLYRLNEKILNESEKKIDFTRIFAGNDKKFYVNLVEKEFFYESETLGEKMLIEILPVKWELKQESKKIGNYTCYKAIDLNSKEKKTEVWYTPEIPFQFGPKNYFGLPGMIIEINESSGYTFKVSKIELNVKQINLIKPNEGIKISAEEYKDMIKKKSPFRN